MIPRPPATRTLTDYIVIVFVILVVVVLLALTFTAIALTLFTDKSVNAFVAIITDMMTHIVSALIGFIAGRSAVRSMNGNGK